MSAVEVLDARVTPRGRVARCFFQNGDASLRGFPEKGLIIMSNLLKLLKTLVPTMPSQRERDESYLAEAQNLADLEQRIREIEAKGRHASSDMPFGLGLR